MQQLSRECWTQRWDAACYRRWTTTPSEYNPRCTPGLLCAALQIKVSARRSCRALGCDGVRLPAGRAVTTRRSEKHLKFNLRSKNTGHRLPKSAEVIQLVPPLSLGMGFEAQIFCFRERAEEHLSNHCACSGGPRDPEL